MFAIKKYVDLIFQKRVLAGPPLKFGYVKENKLPPLAADKILLQINPWRFPHDPTHYFQVQRCSHN